MEPKPPVELEGDEREAPATVTSFLEEVERIRHRLAAAAALRAEAVRNSVPLRMQEQLVRALERSQTLEREAAGLRTRAERLDRELTEVRSIKERLEAEFRDQEGRQSFRFARAVVAAKRHPALFWKVPVEGAKLLVPWSIRHPLGVRLARARAATHRLEARVLAWREGPPPRMRRWPADRPLVSVIIICFNYGRFVEEALASVLRQTLQDFEIILVDGGSTDRSTVEKVQSLEEPRLRKIFQPQPTRVARNRLLGLEQARGKYAVFLDADDLLAPTYLEKAVLSLELTGSDIAYPQVRVFGLSTDFWDPAVEFTLENLAAENNIPTVSMFSVERWKKLKIGYNVDTEYFEDWDFWLRFALAGARGEKLREPLMLYRKHGPTSLTETSKIRHQALREAVLESHRKQLDNRGRVLRTSARQRLRPRPRVEDSSVNLARVRRDWSGKLRIAVATPWLAIGGSDALLLQIFAGARRYGAEVLFYTTEGQLPSMGSSTEDHLKLTDDVFELQRFLAPQHFGEAIHHLLRSREINLLFLVGSKVTYQLLPGLKQTFPEIRVVDHLYNTVGHLESNRAFAGQIDFNIVANREVRDALSSRGESLERIEIIRHGIELDRYRLADFPRRDELPGLKLASGDRLILYAGRLSEEKGVSRFVEICGALRDEPRTVFAMIGDGPERERVLRKRAEMGLEARVSILGFQEPRPFLRRADVVVIPSDVDGLPLVSLEALALGTPVVASRVGALPEVIAEGSTGFIAEPTNLHSYVEGIRAALALGNDRAALADRCQASVATFGMETVRDRYFEIFDRLVERR
jgi:glycosyltransferase involved in cell wall biosynthesis